jgi:hypothetical protein
VVSYSYWLFVGLVMATLKAPWPTLWAVSSTYDVAQVNIKRGTA